MQLKNQYWVLRHGRSRANEAGIICSSVENGTKPEWGLAPTGFEQAAAAGQLFAQRAQQQGGPLRVIASPFSRTMDTARAFVEQVGGGGAGQVEEALELRERFFGEALELGDDAKYRDVWAHDASEGGVSTPPPFSAGAESVEGVARRLAGLLGKLETSGPGGGTTFVLIAHGDVLQIFQASLAGQLANHRSFALETGELRRVEDPGEVDLEGLGGLP